MQIYYVVLCIFFFYLVQFRSFELTFGVGIKVINFVLWLQNFALLAKLVCLSPSKRVGLF